jgi:hypothetical protein
MLWPIFERMPVLDRIHPSVGIMTYVDVSAVARAPCTAVLQSSLPKLAAYWARMRSHPKLAPYLRSLDDMTTFLTGAGGFAYPENPNFDLGL